MATLVPLMPCASTGISFQSILASPRLSFAWWIRRACAGLLLPRPRGACRKASPTFHRPISPHFGCVYLTESSLAIFLEVMSVHGFLPFLVVGTGVPVVPLLLYWAIRRSTRGDGLHSSKSIRIEKRSVFLFLLPRSRLAGPFAVLACFPPGWNGGFHLWRLPGEPLGRGRAFFNRLVLSDSRALGAGLPGLPGSWSLELLPPSRSGCV